ncbi:MAG: class I SAM-dependent methyltransferase [Planctomycetes bacterium]|nr:class I SAM-dependent methyltransferase [Planctomycetota bacterium]
MAQSDRERWDANYRAGSHHEHQPSAVLVGLLPYFAAPGRALDIGGGLGRHAIWLAEQGWKVTLVDVSEVGLAIARERSANRSVILDFVERDLETEPLPGANWDLLLCFHFLHRPIVQSARRYLAPGGRLVVVQPTITNLERNARPPSRFLLQPGELHALITDLHLLHYQEAWTSEDRHEAILVAERSTAEDHYRGGRSIFTAESTESAEIF